MPRRLLAVAFAAIALAACSGDDDAAAPDATEERPEGTAGNAGSTGSGDDATPGDEPVGRVTTTTEEPTPAPPAAGGGPGSPATGATDGSEAACQEIAGVVEDVQFDLRGDADELRAGAQRLVEVAARAPEEIQAPMTTFAGAYDQISRMIAEAGIDPGADQPTEDDLAAMAEIEATMSKLSAEGFQEDAMAVRQWLETTCGAELGR